MTHTANCRKDWTKSPMVPCSCGADFVTDLEDIADELEKLARDRGEAVTSQKLFAIAQDLKQIARSVSR